MARVPLDTGAAMPNPDLLKRDPMAELFGPGSSVKLIGDPSDDIPDEVRAAVEDFGLSKRSFTCVLKELPAGVTFNSDTTGSQNASYIKGWTRSIPSIEYIAKNFGPGSYVLSLTWRSHDNDEEDGKSKSRHQDIPIEISQKYMDEYKKHRFAAKLADAKEKGEAVQSSLIEQKLEGQILEAVRGKPDAPVENPVEMAQKYIQQTLETVKMLGIPLGGAAIQPQKGIEWEKIIPAIAPIVTALITVQQGQAAAQNSQFEKMFMLMMAQQSKASEHMIEMMKAQTGVGSGATQFKEIRDMIFGAIDIKNALAGEEKETLADKIFRMIEAVAPQILSIAATAQQAQAQANNPMVKFAKGYIEQNPDFQALKNDPVEMTKAIHKMDSFFGWKQTDVILQIAGWPRPDDCPRLEEQSEPPKVEQEVTQG